MDTQAEIAQAIALLENIDEDPAYPPSVILMSPDSGNFINGNAGGFVHLAIASLRAAQGEQQSFKNASWVGVDETDWILHGLTPNADAHLYRPTKRRKLNDRVALVLAAILGIAVMACFSVGLLDIVHAMFRR
jgi:hypothetical protein